MNHHTTNLRVYVYEVYLQHLTTVTQLMNCESDHFSSRVLAIWRDPCDGPIMDSAKALVVVEHSNDYPCVTNEWEPFICENMRLKGLRGEV